MKFVLASPTFHERWDYRNPHEFGIGCSETSHVELAWRLARRGHEVVSYSPIRSDTAGEWRGVSWRNVDDVDWEQDGTWLLYRHPPSLDRLERRAGRQVWFVAQDVDYRSMTEERAGRIDRYVCLCDAHARHTLRVHPYLEGKVYLSSNGIRSEEIRRLPRDVPRNPRRLMWASSPDRGLIHLLRTFRKAREFVRDLELHVFYGWDNIDKGIAAGDKAWAKIKAETVAEMNQPGVTWHGRVGQRDLWLEWLKTGIFAYQTNMWETSCATVMEAQALGAVPITNPIWGLARNTRHGVLVDGDAYGDRLAQARYLAEIVKLALDPELQKRIRADMVPDAMFFFNWERQVDVLECWSMGEVGYFPVQFCFQRRHAVGRILNVGSCGDPFNFARLGAVNLDVRVEDPNTGANNKADIVADIRTFRPEPEFDCAIVGDVLEHLTHEDGVRALANCRAAVRNGGHVILTVPRDDRPEEFHRANMDRIRVKEYAPGSSCGHRLVTTEEVLRMVEEAGMRPRVIQEIDYGFCEGVGVVCS